MLDILAIFILLCFWIFIIGPAFMIGTGTYRQTVENVAGFTCVLVLILIGIVLLIGAFGWAVNQLFY